MRRALRLGGALVAAASDLLGEGLEAEKKEVSGVVMKTSTCYRPTRDAQGAVWSRELKPKTGSAGVPVETRTYSRRVAGRCCQGACRKF